MFKLLLDLTGISDLKKLAKRGALQAQFYLGQYYCFGLIVEKDFAQSIKWLTKASEEGYAEVQCAVGFNLISQDPKKAIMWLTLASNQGNAKSQHLHSIVSMTQYGLYLRDRAFAGIDISKHAQNVVQFRNEAISKLDYLGMFKRIISECSLTQEMTDDFIARVVTKPLTKDDGTSTSKAKAEL